MLWLCENFAPFAVAAASSVVVWMFGGTRGSLLLPVVPWLVAILLETLFFFPQRRPGETTYAARERVWRGVKRDPLTWVAVSLFAVLLVPFLNNGLCTICDAKLIAEGIPAEPPVPVIPFCMNRHDHLNVVLWFALALSSLVVVRQALTRSGKRLVLELIVWNGVAVAALGFIQNAFGAPGPFWDSNPGTIYGAGDFFATFGYPNMAGDYFTTLFGLSLALWRHTLDDYRAIYEAKDISSTAIPPHRQFWKKHYFLIPAVICFYAALNTLSRAAILLATTTCIVYFLHSFVSFVAHKSKADRVRAAAWTLLGVGIVCTLAYVFAPKGIDKELDTLDTAAVLDRVSGRGQYHTRVATEIWKDHALFGCGGWGYIHACIPKMTEAELKKGVQMVGGINVHNDYLQFLAEHGLVGFGAMVALVVLLLGPVAGTWRRLAREARFMKGRNAPPHPTQIFALPAPAFFILVACAASLVHAFGDCPFRSPAVLTLFYVSLAAIPGFLPRLTDPSK